MPNKLITVVNNAIFFLKLYDATFLPRGKNTQVCGWMIFFVFCAVSKDLVIWLPSDGSDLFADAELFLRTGKIKQKDGRKGGQTKHVNISCFAFLICVKNSVDDIIDLHKYVVGQLVFKLCQFVFI